MWDWLVAIEHELLLFAGFFFLLGSIDELAVDAVWMLHRIKRPRASATIDRAALAARPLSGRTAVFIPAWHEAAVIGHTVRHMRLAWPQQELRIYVGCYRNDPATAEAARRGAEGDARVRIVIHDHDGPTTKADCLNCLYQALEAEEARWGFQARMVLLHDAEDMVDEAALGAIDKAMATADFVQIPVLALPQKRSRWIGSHYLEEFAESHAKTMVVRAALGAGLPAAGVGCAFDRAILANMARRAEDAGPFALGSLTEDYELGLKIGHAGGRSTFLRLRGGDGRLVATRAYFPAALDNAVRQKSRWLHGIAFQGWDRLGWGSGVGEWWMRLRDRRGPLAAIVLFAGYILLVIGTIHVALNWFGANIPWRLSAFEEFLVVANFIGLAWRAVMRFAFTTREFGLVEGLRAVLRLPVSNVIAMMAGRRAVFAYIRSLGGTQPQWDKTAHDQHPAATIIRPEARA